MHLTLSIQRSGVESRPNEAIRLNLFSRKRWPMARIEYLKQQIALAERLAKAILDRQTAERLQAFAAECRTELPELTLKTAA